MMLRADNRASRALTVSAAMIGGVALAWATAKSRPDLSDEIMAAVRRVLGEVGGEGGEPRN
jgi:TetR/AcrR family transcriptional repressor of nem operon